jgi:methionine-rich copper-binding protein CopC
VAPGRSTRAAALVATALTAVAAAILAAPPSAAAHAALISSIPRDTSTVAVAPRAVTLTFDQPIQADGAEVAVTDPAGSTVTAAAPQVRGAVVVQQVPVIGPGTFTVAYRVVSADGHPVQGVLSFTIGTGSSPPAPTAGNRRSGKLAWTYGLLAVLLVGLAAAGIVLAGADRSKRRG